MIRTLALVGVLVSATSALAGSLQPVMGSQWEKDNPGTLPYEKCAIEAWNGNQIWTQIGGSLIYGGQKMYDGALLRLHCTAPKHNLEFAIPVAIEKIRRAGITAELSNQLWNRKITVSNLNGKSVSDLFGKFGGFGMGMGVIVGGNVDLLVNSKMIFMRDSNSGLELGASLGYYSLRLAPRAKIADVECRDPYFVAPAIEGATCGSVDPAKFAEFRFVRLKK